MSVEVLGNPMQAQAALPQLTIGQLAEHIFASRRITRRDQSLLMSLLSGTSLGEQEQNLINRISEAMLKGLLRVVD